MSEPRDYLVIIEKSVNCWSAYAPDVDGCIATGATREETEKLFAEALAMHLASLARHGEPIPEPVSYATHIKVA